MHIYHQDARIFLNKNKKKYDAVYIDAFTAHASIPYHLTTIEAIEKIYNSLNENGVVLLNIIGSLEGKNSRFLKAEHKTYASFFPQVFLFPVWGVDDENLVQNIILIALKSESENIFEKENLEFQGFLNNLWDKTITTKLPILTDDFAPVDYYALSLVL